MKNFKSLIKNCRYIIIQILVSLIGMILLKRLSIFQTVNAINAEDYPMTAQWPRHVLISKRKILHEFGLRITFWKDSLKICMKNLSTLPAPNNH